MDIIKKIIKRDQKAFERFYLETHSKLYSFVYAKVKDRYTSQEILQNAYITLWEKCTSIKPKRYFFEAYLFKIVSNAIITYYKREMLEQQFKLNYATILRNENEEISVADIKESNIVKAKRRFSNLTKRQKEVFNLVKIEGLPYIGAANELNISKRTVESHLRKAIINLQNEF